MNSPLLVPNFIKIFIKKKIYELFCSTFKIQIYPNDHYLESIRLIMSNNLRIEAGDVESIRLMVNHGLRIEAGAVDAIRFICSENISSENLKKVVELLGMNHIGEIFDIDGERRLYYSQEGEDMILNRIFQNKNSGFYVDIGAFDPKRFSNTYFFYKKGWKGINIEPAGESIQEFRRLRPRDLTLQVAVGNNEDERKFFQFDEPALNTFSENTANLYVAAGYKITAIKLLKPKKLSDLLQIHPSDHTIDFMSIDVEGFELEVLKSNDWFRFRPSVLLIEFLGCDLVNLNDHEAHQFIASKDYELYAKTFNTFIYLDANKNHSKKSHQ